MERASKKTNNRRHPGIKGKRPDRKGQRKENVAKAEAAWAKLTPEQKAARNPKKADKYMAVETICAALS